ncbi:hypothetical protein MYK68_18005 [Gordonia sp. PP30]|uniref:hypothetical protein n=1 Tax=unclassified Gordonia (in: high G+C Gram-positive bacteria) TaxID=2657482 RepID=UPI001FFFDC99|nr:hypothetical protein [Gordonia sp. PP30]UQE74586.1 hypothetical protein MYK68_18005 [Gordonia sp. PP30]
MTGNTKRVDPGAIRHPVWTAIGVLIVVAAIAAGIALWVIGSRDKVQITSTTFSTQVWPVAEGATSTPLDVAVRNHGDDLRTTSIDTAVLEAYSLAPCFDSTALDARTAEPAETIDGDYTIKLSAVTDASSAMAAQTVTTPFDHAVPGGGGSTFTFSVGPSSQPANRVQAFVFRPTLNLNRGNLGLPSVALATTPELVRAYLDGIAALSPDARAAQASCARSQVNQIDRLFALSSLRSAPLTQLHDAYAALAG